MPYKLAAFDVDGTLVRSKNNKVVWEIFNRHFAGDDSINQERFAKYRSGEISYEEWVALDVDHWIEVKATRQVMSELIRTELSIIDGANELLLTLKNEGLIVAVISGTLDITLDVLFADKPFDAVFTNKLFFDREDYLCGYQATSYDMEGKARALEELAMRFDVDLKESFYVGDHINDLAVMEKAGYSIAFEPKDERVAQCADVVIHDDLMKVVGLIL